MPQRLTKGETLMEWEAVLQLWTFNQNVAEADEPLSRKPKRHRDSTASQKVNLQTTANIKNARLDNVKST